MRRSRRFEGCGSIAGLSDVSIGYDLSRWEGYRAESNVRTWFFRFGFVSVCYRPCVSQMVSPLWMFVSLLLTVHAVRGRASSGWSNSVMYDAVTSTVVTVPAAPEGLSGGAGVGEVVLTWDDPGHATIARYEVK